jgi:hypothetical protein
MTVLPRLVSVGNVLADGLLLGGGRSGIVSFELEQNLFWLWMVVQNELRTVWSMGADSPPIKTETGAETWSFCMGCPNELRTIRPGCNGQLREAFIENIAVGFEMADRPGLVRRTVRETSVFTGFEFNG